MAFNWEDYRDEICALYLVQRKTMKQIATHMQDTYGLTACDRTYWKKISQWGAQKYAPARQAQRTKRPSIDSGYQSQSLQSCCSPVSQCSQSAQDFSSQRESLASFDRQSRKHGISYTTSASQSTYGSRPSSPWSAVSSQVDNFPIGSVLSPSVSLQPLGNRSVAGASLSNQKQSVHQGQSTLAKAQSSPPSTCAAHSRITPCVLDFCTPNALPPKCRAAHLEMEMLGFNDGPPSCQHCHATKLHHLASIAQLTNLSEFKSIVLDYQSILEQRDVQGNTCVHFAASSGASLAQFQTLACAGAPMKLSNNAGQTFLHVLNTKLYSRDTLPQIIQWALPEGAMARKDLQKRTVWHSIFQSGVSPEVFSSILEYLFRNEDDMMMPDSENHTPLDCLRSYWTVTGEVEAINYLDHLQESRRLPQYCAVNRTSPLDDATYEFEQPTQLSAALARPADFSRPTTAAYTKRHGLNDFRRQGVDEMLSTYKNGGKLGFNVDLPLIRPSSQPAWPARPSTLPSNLLEKARRILVGS